MESVQEIVDPGQGVSILDGSCVKLTEVNAEAQTTVLFPYHHHWRGPWAVQGTDDITRQHLLYLCHLLPTNCRVLPPVRLAERRPMGLDRMLQQRSIPEIVFTLAEDVAILFKQLIELLLLEQREALQEWWLAWL